MTAISADNPLPGFYWMRRERGGKRIPVAIWRQDGKLVCRAGPDQVDPTSVWTYCAENKVGKDAAKFAFERGFWPDEPPPIAHNEPPSEDPFEALKAEIAAKQEQAEKWLAARPTITTQADADYATNAQRELLALNKRADAMFKAEKAPLLEATRACDAKWSFRSTVADVAERLRKVYGRFMAAEEARLKAEAAAKNKAEQERIEAERKAKLADDPVAALTDPEPQLPLLPEPVKVQAGGGVGRRAGLKTVWVPVIEDYAAALMHYVNHPDIRRELEKRVNHDVRDSKGSCQIPGVKVTQERHAA